MRAMLAGVVLLAIIGLVVAIEISSPSPKRPEDLTMSALTSGDDGYAGLSIGPRDDNNQYIVYIYLTNPSQETAESMAREHLKDRSWGYISEVRPVQVQYSRGQLELWQHWLEAEAKVWSFPGVTGLGTGAIENQISVGVVCAANLEVVERVVRGYMANVDIPQDAVVFELTGRGYIMPKPAPVYTFECVPPEVINHATGIFSPGFGGMYSESNTMYVYMLEPHQGKAEALAATHIGWDAVERMEVRPLQGQYTWEQLQDWYRKLLNGGVNVRGATLCEIDFRSNRITIEVRKDWNQNVVAEVEESLSRLEIPHEAVILMHLDIS